MDFCDLCDYTREKRLADDDTRTVVTGPLSSSSRCLVCGGGAELGPDGKYVKPGTLEPHVHGKTNAQMLSAARAQEIREELWQERKSGRKPRKAKTPLKIGGKQVDV